MGQGREAGGSGEGDRGGEGTEAAGGKGKERDCLRRLFHGQTPADYARILAAESTHYGQSSKFVAKMREADAQWTNPGRTHAGRFTNIHKYLKKLLRAAKASSPEPSVLELGFGGGTNMIVAHEILVSR